MEAKEIKKFTKRVTAKYANDSPFAGLRQDEIEQKIASGELFIFTRDDALTDVWEARLLTRSLTMKDFAQRSITLPAGTMFAKNVFFEDGELALDALKLRMIGLMSRSTKIALEVYAEDFELVGKLIELKFRRIITKVSAYAEIRLIMANFDPRPESFLNSCVIDDKWFDTAESATLLEIERDVVDNCARVNVLAEVDDFTRRFTTSFAPHYSIYNKDNAWAGIALRGYDKHDPAFIEKPTEMSKKWKAENAEKLDLKCEDTWLSKHFPNAMKIVKTVFLNAAQIERVRILKLSRGTIYRHCDIQDREAGVADDFIARFHIPLVTNDKVTFHSWSAYGDKLSLQMRERGLYYLDHRKPHAVTNESDLERLHLVVDVYSNRFVRGLISDAYSKQCPK